MKQNNSKGQLTAQIDLGKPSKSGFKYDYPFKGTGRIGRIYNTRCMQVNPADRVAGKSVAALQFEPLAVPILANMHVKQEHFYVPKNVLWKNFDKFISGGEKLDYQGKVPSMSLKSMWQSFMSFVTGQNSIIPYSIPLVARTGADNFGLQLKRSRVDSFLNFVLQDDIKAILDDNQLLDLFDHVQPLVRQLGESMRNIFDAQTEDVDLTNDAIKLFVKATTVSDYDRTNDKLCWNENQPNKYLRKMYKSVVVMFDGAEQDGLQYLIPTDAGMLFLSYLYEIIKPFFGYSSYLDQMGYNKLTFDNFVYLAVCHLTTYGRLTTDGEQKIFSLVMFHEFMSDFPQEILSLRAQYCVWWNNYRDQLLESNAMEPATTDNISNLELVCLLAPRLRCWHKDSFTTALDNAGTVNAVVPTSNQGTHTSVKMKWRDIEGQAESELERNDGTVYEVRFANEKPFKIPTGLISGLHDSDQDRENSTTNYFSLGMLDACQRAQKWLRKAFYYGNRIQDFLYTHFAVQYLDARLRLPELLATSSQMVDLTTVINNTNIKSEDGTTAVAGDRAAIANAYDNGGYYDRFCEEHGIIISNLTVMPDVTYANVFNKDLAALDQFDYPFPEFATLGMDAVYDVELAQKPVLIMEQDGSLNVSATPQVFGYQGRYYNAKSHLGEEHGELLDTQDMYSFSRDFNIYDPDSRPKLNYIFVHCHPFLDMFVVDNEWSDYFRYDIYHGYDADRLLPVHSIYM